MIVLPEGEEFVRKQLAKMLVHCANVIVTAEKNEFKTSPVASQPGQHLRAVTFNARDSLVYTPTSLAEIEKTLIVRIGFRKSAWYAPYHEIFNRRIGLKKKFDDLKGTGLLGAIKGSYEA